MFGYINLTRAIYAQMKARGGGVIVNDIGAAGEKFDANYICGSAGNAALMAFTRALGGKSLADNIRVVGINPGPVGTDRHVTLLKTRAKNQFGDENRYKEFQKGLPLGRPAYAREIGDLMAFLASDRSGYTSGVIFTVDGGKLSSGLGLGCSQHNAIDVILTGARSCAPRRMGHGLSSFQRLAEEARNLRIDGLIQSSCSTSCANVLQGAMPLTSS